MRIIAVGKIKEPWIRQGIDEYLKRMRDIEIIEIKDSCKEKEAIKILELIDRKKEEDIFLLTEEGIPSTSMEFSKTDFSKACFVIGGPEGLDDKLKKKYKTISLSKMTFTHEMARLFFIEQLYRAQTIKQNKSYHR